MPRKREVVKRDSGRDMYQIFRDIRIYIGDLLKLEEVADVEGMVEARTLRLNLEAALEESYIGRVIDREDE